jgi:hypothetical protein
LGGETKELFQGKDRRTKKYIWIAAAPQGPDTTRDRSKEQDIIFEARKRN